MIDREKVEEIKESVRQFIQNHEDYPSTEDMQDVLHVYRTEDLVAMYELLIENEVIYNPNEDIWHLLTIMPISDSSKQTVKNDE